MKGSQTINLPISWALSPLTDVAEINPKLDKADFVDSLEVSFVPMPAVQARTGEINVTKTRRFGEVKKGYTAFREGDVLFAKITPCMENGKMAVVPKVCNGLAFGSTEFHVLRARRGINAHYIYHFVSSQRFRFDAEHNMTGAVGQRRVPTAYLTDHLIPIPPSAAQIRIVAKIEELLSELDNGIENLETAREQLTVYRQALLKHAFDGKMTADWREKNKQKLKPADALRREILDVRRTTWEKTQSKRYKMPVSIDAADLPPLPRAWAWVSLDELVSGEPRSLQSGPFGSSLKHSEFRQEGILVIGIDNVGRGQFSLGSQNRLPKAKFKKLIKYQARPGDLLITVMASLGRTCVVPRSLETAIITKHVYRVSTDQNYVLPEFYNLALQGPTVSRKRMLQGAQGQTRPGLNSSILREIPLPLCSLAEQQEIVSRLSQRLSELENLDKTVEEELLRAEALRQAILKTAFLGQLVAQDQNDEPASLLLERIKRETAETENGKKKSRRRVAA